ncbi:GntR family transcriptional regulator [Vannielia litorea]|uniref:GntR family transcriptional regulator n=1 Tax=Vannielia litorea TaxID=1217970 RepID=UPI001C953634|nr:GntR family transcriptional regulator [Vannielia litorea]MBY6048825.1 GntR family transcriptional regulator [Vannielia litorea]MBY6076239.1 GntR family transcriptional regulator [Vannielia litorea]
MADKLLPEQIAKRLRREILRGTLRPGASIKERDNAAELGVSRTPMREAIRILSLEGLVELRPSRSPIVADPTWKEVVDNLEVLKALELLSGELAVAHASEADIDAAAAVQARMEKLAPTTDEIDLFEVDMEFHSALVRASGNPALAETHSTYLAKLWRARFLGSRIGRSQQRVFDEHNGIIQGLRDRDRRKVKSTISAHLDALRRQIRRHFDTNTRVGELQPNPTTEAADDVTPAK